MVSNHLQNFISLLKFVLIIFFQMIRYDIIIHRNVKLYPLFIQIIMRTFVPLLSKVTIQNISFYVSEIHIYTYEFQS